MTLTQNNMTQRTDTAIWITKNKNSEDHVPNLTQVGRDYHIRWCGQPETYSSALDDYVARGTFVFYRKSASQAFTFIGRVLRKHVIRARVDKAVAGIYDLQVRKTTCYGHVFHRIAGDLGTGCFRRAVTQSIGWSSGPEFYFKGISRHTRNAVHNVM
jgi:hypothetical protein